MTMNRRALLLSGAASALLPMSARASEEAEPPLLAEDYAAARAGFQTRLLREGPAPDGGESLDPPPGARRISYRSGGLELAAWLSDDATSTAKRPAILFLHGGNALWHGHWDLTKPYREAGYVAMMPAFRAENGQPGFFSGFYDETADALATATTLRALPGVDPARLFLAGHSVGGTLTLLAAMSAPTFRAAAAFSPNPDARAFFRRFPEDIRFDAGNPREFEMRSAACYATSFKCPLLMLHGSEETRSEDAIRLTSARAKAAGLDVRHGIVPGSHTSALPGETAESLRFFAGI
ncbi:alpha/beta hydrolase family protein [Aureimonas leprariae]|uniref:Prolyl oligopeptidase family serine peptidase n=1 Tax=Plantimonas leprariae TaxID=2615207 RepID=A0A7V7TVU3_9HYPH|nr:prolyl oligopeptidase family serine peptidase [Aureimonas leprariae]KAB0678839.1 prolyl oligopeptidase family serine peptidase [Aureimonas leprariae]